MSHTPHGLHDDFPDHTDAIRSLRLSNTNFATLTDTYHAVNRAVHRAETDIEPTDDAHMTEMRRQRMVLKDQIWAMLSGGRA